MNISHWLVVVFVTLKLTGVLAWSWVWVFAPVWIPGAFALVMFVVCAVMLGSVSKAWKAFRKGLK